MYDKLKDYLSEERLKTYLDFTNNDKEKAVELYNLNIKIGKNFYPLLSYFEIILRNVINNKLIEKVGENWFDNKNIIIGNNPIKSRKTLEKLNETKNNIYENKKFIENYKITNSDIVSNLSFGFWVNLLSANYENNIWQPYIKYIFKGFKRKDIYEIINNIRMFRNRVFHYENIIFKCNYKEIYNNINKIINTITKNGLNEYLNEIIDFNI